MPSGLLICYKQGRILVLRDKIVEKIISINVGQVGRVLGGSLMLSRLLRLGIRAAEPIDNTTIVISRGSYLYELNIVTGDLSKGCHCGEGIRPLVFTTVKGIKGFEEGVIFGGYLGNMAKNPVSIYKRTGVDRWDIVYTFSQGTINHVHNILPDPYRNCLWIFTGDFGEASAIWKVTGNFKKVERVVCNDQKYRACVAYALPEGLLYATDAPFADNYIYLMNTDSYEVKEIFPIDGSCIYGCKWRDHYVFSSTVEGDGRNTSKMEFLFGRKRGAGIKDDNVHMYKGNLKDDFKEIYKEKKDCMPYYTFQFGVFKFPYGINNSDVLYFQPVATKINDQNLMAYSE